MKNSDVKKEFIEMRAKGYSFESIAKQLNVAKSTLINWSKELNQEISNLKAIEMEALYEQFYVTKKNRIELIGKQVKKIEEELRERDLKDIPTDKLYHLLLKSIESLKEEDSGVHFTVEEEETLDDVLDQFNKKTKTWKAV